MKLTSLKHICQFSLKREEEEEEEANTCVKTVVVRGFEPRTSG
jgi:hypothetical protein